MSAPLQMDDATVISSVGNMYDVYNTSQEVTAKFFSYISVIFFFIDASQVIVRAGLCDVDQCYAAHASGGGGGNWGSVCIT